MFVIFFNFFFFLVVSFLFFFPDVWEGGFCGLETVGIDAGVLYFVVVSSLCFGRLHVCLPVVLASFVRSVMVVFISTLLFVCGNGFWKFFWSPTVEGASFRLCTVQEFACFAFGFVLRDIAMV